MSKYHYEIVSKKRMKYENKTVHITDVVKLEENKKTIIRNNIKIDESEKNKNRFMKIITKNIALFSILILSIFFVVESFVYDSQNTLCVFLAIYSSMITLYNVIKNKSNTTDEQKNKAFIFIHVLGILFILVLLISQNMEMRSKISNIISAFMITVSLVLEIIDGN